MSVLQLKKCLSEPKQLLKLVAIILCLCVACYQLSGCFYKIFHPPISTHYSFQLNETLSFPSLTICRNPAFKTTVFSKYGLTSGGPKYPTAWRNFNFSVYTMDEFFEEATYTFHEVISFYGFDRLTENVITSTFFNAEYGRCFVFTPKSDMTIWSSTGYFLYLKHSETVKKLSNYGVSLSGYHVYIHDRNDVYKGPKFNGDTLMDYIYIENGEDLRLNVKVQDFVQLSRNEHHCNDSYHYSQSRCEKNCLFKRLTEEIGCSTPWIVNEELPRCNNFDQMFNLIKLYDNFAKQYIIECDCPKECHLRVYTLYIENRRDVELPTSQLSITFASNIITIMKEIVGYDWNMFLSDLGGSLGFLLGISVIGFIGILENFVKTIRRSNERLNESVNVKPRSERRDYVKADSDGREFTEGVNPKEENVTLSGVNQYMPQKETHDFVSTKY